MTDKEQALIAAADAKANLAEKRAKAYADGKITATEQLAIDKAAAAYKAAVKKAKEMDGEIQVGGRNLLRGSRSMDLLTWGWDSDGFQNPFRTYDDQDGFKVVRIERAGKTDKAYNYRWCFLTNALTVNLSKETYTISFDYKSNYSGEHLSFSYWRKDGRGQENRHNGPDSSEWRRGSITLDLRGNNLLVPASKNECLISIVCGTSAGQYTEIRRLKLERGTVATDWTPAPEDVQAEIDAAKEQADKAQTSTESLRGYVDGAFRDGVVDDAEAKAIKTYINEVEAMWSSAFGAYERVYVNPLLTGSPKTALGDAKITLAGAKDNLVGQIKSAISDGRATNAEATETERLYNVYKGALRDFQKALKEAEEAIRDAGKTTGGRNLARADAFATIGNAASFLIPIDCHVGDTYTLSFEYMITPDDPASERGVFVSERTAENTNVHIIANDTNAAVDGKWHKWSRTFTITETATVAIAGWALNYSQSNGRIRGKTANARRLKLERGTVATDWTPAPEDVQAEIDKVERGYQKLIERVDVEFAISSSRTTAPQSGWQTDAPTTAKGQFLWQRTKVYLKDGTEEVRGTTCIQGRDGTDGGKGADGRGIANVKELYYLSTSNTELKGGAWSETAPTPREGCWIWTMTRIYYTTGTPTSTKPICVTGAKGDRGADGTSQYTNTWIDATGLDSDKYFPVTIYSSSNKRQYISLLNSLNGSVPPWSTHQNGFTVSVQWSTIGSGWGAIDITRSITNASYRFAKDGVVPVGDIGQVYETSEEYIYVRGAGKYFFTTSYEDGTPGSVPTLHPDGYEWKSGSYSRTLPVKASVTFPLTDSEVERKERKAEVAAVRSGLANTDTLVSALEKAQNKLDQGVLTKADTKDIQYLLDSLKNGDTQVAGGLVLSNDIILSDPNSKDVTATISGTQTQGANVMRLGISYTCDEDKKATVERAGAKWGINLSSILTGLESDSERIRKLDELGFTIVGGRSLGWPKWEICKATDAKEGGEATALANDGTGHIGELYFSGEEIGFGASDKRYMQIGGTARAEYDMVNASTVIRKFGISGGTVRKSGTFALDTFNSRYSNREIKYTANLSAWAEARAYRVPDNGGWDPNDHRYHKPEYQEFVRTESSATVQLRLELTRGGSSIKTVTSPQVSVSVSAQGGQFGINEEIPQSALYAEDRKSQDVTITISPSDVREQDTVTLSLVTTIRRYCYHHQGSEEIDRYASATASAGSIINFLPYDTSQPMVSVTKDRAAFFYGRSKYILLNYLRDCVMKVVGNMLLQGNLTLKGDLTTDSIICKSGGLYSGGVINEYGTVTRWVGRKITVWKVSTGRYKLSHNLGHINYVVQAIPVHSSDNNCFVIDGTETAHTVEVGVQWNSSWTNRAIHFVIYAQQ